MSICEMNYSCSMESRLARRIWTLVACCSLTIDLLCQSTFSQTGAPSKVENPPDRGMVSASGEKAPAVQPVDSQRAPRIVLENTTHDFEKIRPGSTNTASFRLTNGGDSVLQIMDVKQCCGAVAMLDKRKLAPAESAVLTAECHVAQMSGKFNKKIGILTNDPKNPQTELTLTGEVVPTLSWTPTRFELAAYKEDAACPEIRIKSLDGAPFAVKGFSATGQCLRADCDPNNKASEFILRPKVDRAKLEAQRGAPGRVKIDVTHRDYEAIYVDFEVKPIFEIAPPRIFVMNAEPGHAVLRTLQVQDRRTASGGDVARAIESIRFKNGGRVQMRGVIGNGKSCEMSLAFWPAGDQKQESFWSDQLVIRMKEGREVTVPVHVLFKPQPLSSAANPASGS